ncbi:beclin 1-associated autophagy-related key regulator-like isoform X2 [Pomacea canaliculata]|nr:beclin 1-associated autophagy-related key regulator-like isoform X2 [Pomacea canaliculata]
MADWACQEELPPLEFEFSSLFGSEEVLQVAVERCPLCAGTGGPFYCSSCTNSGLFIHSKATVPERYIDVRQRFDLRNKERQLLAERIKESVSKQEAIQVKQEEVEGCRQRIKLLKSAISSALTKNQQYKKEFKRRCREREQKSERVQQFKQRTSKANRTLKVACQDLQNRRNQHEKESEVLCAERKRAMHELVDCIFPMQEITPVFASSLGLDSEGLAQSTVTALKEACQTAYLSGHWVLTDHEGNTAFKIVESTVPGNGDYSAAISKGSQSMLGCEEQENEKRPWENPSNAVLTALSHLTQFTMTAADILQVFLPRRLCFSKFCGGELSERQLHSAVSRLNCNVLALCLSQGVDARQLSLRLTVHNILALFKAPHLGRDLPYVQECCLVRAVADVSISDDSEDEGWTAENEAVDEVDWVRVDRNLPEIKVPTCGGVAFSWTVNTATYAGHMLAETQSTASGLVTSAAASVASFWRAARSRFDPL